MSLSTQTTGLGISQICISKNKVFIVEEKDTVQHKQKWNNLSVWPAESRPEGDHVQDRGKHEGQRRAGHGSNLE